MAEKDLSVKLVNPFSGEIIHLPPIMVAIPGFHTVPEYYIHRVILSCDPCLYPYSYVVAAMYNSAPVVAFIKSGEQSWTYVYNKFRPVNDILFHKEQLYAVNSRNQVLVIDYEGNDSSDDSEDEDEDEDDDEVEYYEGPCVEYLISQPTEYSHVSYLVESLDGGLLLVRRRYLEIIDDINCKVTVGFKVYRMTRKHSSDEEEEPEWVEIKSLPNILLFVGDNHSICIPAFGFCNCQSNCMYFADDCTERDPDAPYEAADMGIFHLESGQIGKHYELPQSLSYLPPAVWILPKLQ
ncbi:F-box protein SKIP23-like [Coffea arabica]|uniref:F-box protein SKIP23-like n=1 Tax=Coffea arabica TaxID=13443 RepID=A0ABM4W5X7_COFAR